MPGDAEPPVPMIPEINVLLLSSVLACPPCRCGDETVDATQTGLNMAVNAIEGYGSCHEDDGVGQSFRRRRSEAFARRRARGSNTSYA